MEGIRSIEKERTDLATHVDLCGQRWEAVYKKVSRLETICMLLLAEATISALRNLADPTFIPMLRELIKMFI